MENLHLLPQNSKNRKSESDYYLSENIFPDDINNDSNKNIIDKDFWDSEQKIKNFEKICSDTFKKSLIILCKYLNEVHNKHENDVYWSKMLSYWLDKHIVNTLEKVYRFDDIFEKNESYNISILNPVCYKTPTDTMEFLNALREERFIHQQYYSIILKNKYKYKCNFKYYYRDWDFYENKIDSSLTFKEKLKNKIIDFIMKLMNIFGSIFTTD